MSRSSSKTKLSSSGSRSSLKDKAKRRGGEAEDQREEAGGEEEVAVEQLSWKVLGKTETAELARLDDPHQIARKLSAVLGLSQCQESLCEAALLDYYVATYCFGREHKFNEEQISTLITITHILIANLRDQHLSLAENIQHLRGMLVGVGVSQRTAVQCLTPEVARLVVECVTTGLFQHYRLFQFLLHEQQTELQIELSLSVEVPPPVAATHCPPPLDEAVSQELYELCTAAQSTATEQEPAEPEEEENQTDEGSALANLTQEEGEALLKVSPEELKAIMDSLTSDTLSAYQTEVFSKLQEKERELTNRLSKLEKSLS